MRTRFLSAKSANPPEEWATCPNAFEPIINPDLFDRAQAAVAGLTIHLSDEDLLDRLRKVLCAHGSLTHDIIDTSRMCPGATTYCHRFGNLLNAYIRLGYSRPELFSSASSRQRIALIRSAFIRSVLELYPEQIREVRQNRRHRALLKCRRTGLLISVLIASCYRTKHGEIYWLVEPPKNERKRDADPTILC